MNREAHVPLSDVNRQRMIKGFSDLANLTNDDIHHLQMLAILIRSGRIVPSRDLEPAALQRLRAEAPATPTPALPGWAQVTPEGNLTIDLTQAATVTIAAPADRRRMLIGPKHSLQVAVDSALAQVIRQPGDGDSWQILPFDAPGV